MFYTSIHSIIFSLTSTCGALDFTYSSLLPRLLSAPPHLSILTFIHSECICWYVTFLTLGYTLICHRIFSISPCWPLYNSITLSHWIAPTSYHTPTKNVLSWNVAFFYYSVFGPNPASFIWLEPLFCSELPLCRALNLTKSSTALVSHPPKRNVDYTI